MKFYVGVALVLVIATVLVQGQIDCGDDSLSCPGGCCPYMENMECCSGDATCAPIGKCPINPIITRESQLAKSKKK